MKKDEQKNAYGNTWESEVADNGEFLRHQTSFRSQIRADGTTDFAPDSGRYHLYVSYACPWAHRTLIARKLKGLEEAIGFDVVDPVLPKTGWTFDGSAPGATGDTVNGFRDLREAYQASNPGFDGAITVPVLWDKQTRQIVNNESAEILRQFNSELQSCATRPDLDLYPEGKRKQIDELNDWIYPCINNGVYRCGFATTQDAYAAAFEVLFAALDWLDARLGDRRFLIGDVITEADWRLFTTLIRFDPVYVGHFKCNLRRIADYPNLSRYLGELSSTPGVAETINMDHIKRHYYVTHRALNPSGIVPLGPILPFAF